MSLNIRFDKVYIEYSAELKEQLFISDNDGDEDDVNNDESNNKTKLFKSISCVCRVSYVNVNGKCIKLGKLTLLNSNSNQKQLKLQQKESNELSNGQAVLKINLKNLVEHQIKNGDKLSFEFFQHGKLFEKPFGTYEMLLDDMRENLKSKLETIINIDDYLTDYKTKLIRKEKISFYLEFINYKKFDSIAVDFSNIQITEISELRESSNEDIQSFIQVHSKHVKDLTKHDFISFIKIFGEFALKHFYTKENDSLAKKFKYASDIDERSLLMFIDSTGLINQMLLTLTFNMLLSYEFEYEEKLRLKKLITKTQIPNLNDSNSINSLLTQLFSTNMYINPREKEFSWQVRVRIIELKYLLSINKHVFMTIQIGDNNVFRTKEKHIDTFKFDEEENNIFMARVNSDTFLNGFINKITISVYEKQFWSSDILLGSFQTDFGTIYKQPGHEVYHKWGELILPSDNVFKSDLKDNLSDQFKEISIKGYIKFDIVVQSQGDTAKIHYEENKKISSNSDDDNYEDDMENNLLTPYGFNRPAIDIELVIEIYYAHILVKEQTKIFDKLKKNLFSTVKNISNSIRLDQNDDRTLIEMSFKNHQNPPLNEFAHLNPFVRVTYLGVSKQSSIINSTNKPNWNEKIIFNTRFPPLTNLIRIDLCSKDTSERILATEYININDISNYHCLDKDLALPAYGPRYISMYSQPDALRSNIIDEDINLINSIDLNSNSDRNSKLNTIDDCASNQNHKPIIAKSYDYVAGLFLSIKSQKLNRPDKIKLPYSRETRKRGQKQQESDNKQQLLPSRELNSFISFAIINEATMIDERYKNYELSFLLCHGVNGYDENQTLSTVYDADENQEYITSTINNNAKNETKLLLEQKKIHTNRTDSQLPIRLGDNMPLYLAFDKAKHCLSIRFYKEDLRVIMFKINFIRHKLNQTIVLYKKIKSLLWPRNEVVLNWKNLKEAKVSIEELLRVANDVKTFLKTVVYSDPFVTDLDKVKSKQIIKEFFNIIDLIMLILKLSSKLINSSLNDRFKYYIDLVIHNSIKQIYVLIKEPLNYFPDLDLWLLANNQPIGICSIKINDIVWSDDSLTRGRICGKTIYTDVKSLNLNDMNDLERQNLARIKVQMWFGQESEIRNIFSSECLPSGFGLSANFMNDLNLPTRIFFTERHKFQLKAYLYQGRNMLLLDTAGESDPFARICLYNQSVTSKTIDNTVNPTWNQTLIIPEIYFYGSLESIKQDPPEIILDAFDQDPFNQKEFMGRICAKPVINLIENNPPKLKWYSLVYYYEQAGDILASFELIYLNESSSNNKQLVNKAILSNFKHVKLIDEIPNSIKPKTRPYTLEILYWGLRNVKENKYIKFGQEKMSVLIEIGQRAIEPNTIENCLPNTNFLVNHRKYEIEMPEEDEYKPHLSIRCVCYGSFFMYPSLRELDMVDNTFSSKILIGSHTINSIGDYCYSNEKLTEFIKNHSNRNYAISSSSSNEQNFRRDSLASRKQKTRQQSGPTSSNEGYLEYLDWWSKYFASINESSKFQDSNDHDHDHDQKSEASYLNGFDSENLLFDSNDSSTAVAMSQGSFKSSLRRDSLLKLKTKTLSFKRKLNKAKDQSKLQASEKQKKHLTEKIKIFDCELEKKFKLHEILETFNLILGKNIPFVKNDVYQCQFKGNFMLYDENNLESNLKDELKKHAGFLKIAQHHLPSRIKIHLYIVKALIINSIHLFGKFEPFLFIECGEKNQFTEKFKIDSIEPLIGKCFEFEAKFPSESQLTISIKNWNILEGTEIIGQTRIDLEDRLLSNRYATCGLPKRYDPEGYNEWRDMLKPKQILTRMCKQFRLMPPKFLDRKIIIKNQEGNIIHEQIQNQETSFSHRLTARSSENKTLAKKKEIEEIEEETENNDELLQALDIGNQDLYEKRQILEEQMALDVLNQWENITQTELIPEHVETRSLYNPDSPELEQGKIQMWIDIFPINESKRLTLPKAIDVSIRKPKKFQLRVIIYNTKEVILDDRNPLTGEQSSDIYVKGFVCDKVNESKRTDTHYRSLTGEGNFNWRLIFDFEYLPAEKKIVYSQKQKFGFTTIQRKMKPTFTLECYDADQLSSDDILGHIEFDLNHLIIGAKTSQVCNLKSLKQKWPRVNLFKVKTAKGWWPFSDPNSKSKLTGKVEAEFRLLTEKEALDDPAGEGHEPPNALPVPARPETSFLWWMRPFDTFRFIIWKHYWRQIIVIILIILVLIGILVAIYQLPGLLVNKFFG